MSSEEPFDGGFGVPVPDGGWSNPLDGEEPESGEVSDTSSNYESLLSLGTRKGKKKPVLLLDPAEAENAARQMELAMTQQMAHVGAAAPNDPPVEIDAPMELDTPMEFHTPDAAGEAPGISGPGAGNGPEPLEDAAAGPVPADLDAHAARDEAEWVGEPDDCETLAACDGPDEAEPVPDTVADCPDWFDSEPPVAGETIEVPDETAEFAVSDAPVEPAPTLPTLTFAKPDFNPRAHGLRARLVAKAQARKTLAQRLVALLRRLYRWIRRNWA